MSSFNKDLKPKASPDLFLFDNNAAAWQAASEHQIPKPEPVKIATPEFKEDPEPEPSEEPDNISIPMADPQTPTKKLPVNAQKNTGVDKSVKQPVKKPEAKPATKTSNPPTSKAVQKTTKKDKPVSKDIPVTKDKPVVKDMPVAKDKPLTKDKPVTKEKPVTKDKPVVIEKLVTNKQSPVKSDKSGKKPDNDTISIPNAEPETPHKTANAANDTISIPSGEPETPKKVPTKPVPERAPSVPPGEPETPRKVPTKPVPERAPSVPPGEPETPRKVPTKPVPERNTPSVPPGEPETPRRTSDTSAAQPEPDSVSVPAAVPETPQKVLNRPAVQMERDAPSVLPADIETSRKIPVKTKPEVKKVSNPVPKQKEDVTPKPKVVADKDIPKDTKRKTSDNEGKPADKQPKPIAKPEKSTLSENNSEKKNVMPRPKPNPLETYKHSPRNQPVDLSGAHKKYGVGIDMKRDVEARDSKSIPNGKVMPFGYKSPPDSPTKLYKPQLDDNANVPANNHSIKPFIPAAKANKPTADVKVTKPGATLKAKIDSKKPSTSQPKKPVRALSDLVSRDIIFD